MFNYGHVYHHLVESTIGLSCYRSNEDADDSSDGEDNLSDTLTEKPLKKGRNLLKSGFVEDVQDNENDKSFFLRAHVQHSMKKDYPLSTKVVISKEVGL